MCYVEAMHDDTPQENDMPQITELCNRLRSSLQQLQHVDHIAPDASPEALSLWIARYAPPESDVVSRHHLLVTRNTLLRLQCCEDILSQRVARG